MEKISILNNGEELSENFSPTKKIGNGIPNITNNIDFKSSQILGSIKAIYLLVASNMQSPTPAASHSETAEASNKHQNSDEYNLFKFKLELKIFLLEIIDYLRLQLQEMNNFISKNHLPENIESELKPGDENSSPDKSKTDEVDSEIETCEPDKSEPKTSNKHY